MNMLNFYQIVKENLSFNRFEYQGTVCLEYTCPIDTEQIGIFSQNDYLAYVLSGKKTYKTVNGEWTLEEGQMLYLKKGAELIHQYFDDEYCMLAFFINDDLIRETYDEMKGSLRLETRERASDFTGIQLSTTDYLDGYFNSMLSFFRGINRPPDPIMVLKLKELLINLMNSSTELASYFGELNETDRPSIRQIMEQNYCFNLRLEDYAELSHRSLSAFKREFKQLYDESPGRWVIRRRIEHASKLIANTNQSITQIAFEAGFEDLSHFSRAFKSHVGVSPTEFKSNMVQS